MRSIALTVLLATLLAVVLPASAGAYVYWGTSNLQSLVGRANLDGSAPNPNFIPGLEARVRSVAVDGSHVYWIDQNHIPPRIGRANLDGSEVITNFVPGDQAVSGLVVSGPYIYWSTSASIGRASLNGTGVDNSFVETTSGIEQVAVGGNHIYWTTEAPYNHIGWAKIEGGEEESKPLFEGPEDLSGIAVDENGIYFYNGAKGIGFINFSGNLTIASAIPGAGGTTMAINAGKVYWANSGNIGRANLDGTELNPNFVSLSPGGAFGLAVDSGGGAAAPPAANPPSPLGPPPPPKPANTFILGKAKLLKKSGGAILTVSLPGPGKLVLKGKGLVTLTKTVKATGNLSLAIKPTKKTAKALKKAGKVKVTAKITFTPTGGIPHTESKVLTLKS